MAAAIKENEILIVDEADIFVFGQYNAFAGLLTDRKCICFSATPTNGDSNDSEIVTLSGFEFAMLKAYKI